MNDRFKFRVWSIANQRYCHFATMDISADGLLRVIRPLEQSEYIDDYENRYIIQQCTGLKDKNGALIYEGDIVKTIQTNPAQIRRGVVLWKSCYFAIGYTKNGKDGESGIGITKDTTDFIEIEVIGNIYENKELLQ